MKQVYSITQLINDKNKLLEFKNFIEEAKELAVDKNNFRYQKIINENEAVSYSKNTKYSVIRQIKNNFFDGYYLTFTQQFFKSAFYQKNKKQSEKIYKEREFNNFNNNEFELVKFLEENENSIFLAQTKNYDDKENLIGNQFYFNSDGKIRRIKNYEKAIYLEKGGINNNPKTDIFFDEDNRIKEYTIWNKTHQIKSKFEKGELIGVVYKTAELRYPTKIKGGELIFEINFKNEIDKNSLLEMIKNLLNKEKNWLKIIREM